MHIYKAHGDQIFTEFQTVKEEIHEEPMSDSSEDSRYRPANHVLRNIPLGWKKFYMDPPIQMIGIPLN